MTWDVTLIVLYTWFDWQACRRGLRCQFVAYGVWRRKLLVRGNPCMLNACTANLVIKAIVSVIQLLFCVSNSWVQHYANSTSQNLISHWQTEGIFCARDDHSESLHKWHVYVTGHSLGGALATLLALELSSNQLAKYVYYFSHTCISSIYIL